MTRLLDRLAVWWLWHRRGHSGSWVGRSISRPMVVDDLAPMVVDDLAE